MKQFFVFVQKEFRHILRDRRTMLILLVMPIIQIILFGFALTTEVKNTPIAVFAPTPNAENTKIIERLNASQYFTVIKLLRSPNEIDKALHDNETKMVVVFDEDNKVQLLADATEPNQAASFSAYATSIITGSPASSLVEVSMLYNPHLKGSYNFVPGVMGLILMLICAMMTSISIVREKETGTMELLLASPVHPINIIMGKLAPYFVLSVVNLTTILLMSKFVLGVPLGSIATLILTSLLFIITALSLGLLISNFASTQVAAMLASGMGLMMPTMILSGMIFPVENMPLPLQYLSTVLPARWYIDAVRKLMIQGVSIEFVMKELLILTTMATILLVVARRTFRSRLS